MCVQSATRPQTHGYTRRLVIRGMQSGNMDGRVFMCVGSRDDEPLLPPPLLLPLPHTQLKLKQEEKWTIHLLPCLTPQQLCMQPHPHSEDSMFLSSVWMQTRSQLPASTIDWALWLNDEAEEQDVDRESSSTLSIKSLSIYSFLFFSPTVWACVCSVFLFVTGHLLKRIPWLTRHVSDEDDNSNMEACAAIKWFL